MQTEAPCTVPGFARTIDEILATTRDPNFLMGKVAVAMAEYLQHPGCVPEPFRGPHPDPNRYARYLMHRHPQGKYVIMSLVWGGLQGTPIHDHGCWGLMGVLNNQIGVTTYLRRDDGTRYGHAELEKFQTFYATAPSVVNIYPPLDEIHEIFNPTPDPVVSVHVYGREMTWCNIFDPATNSYRRQELQYTAAPGA